MSRSKYKTLVKYGLLIPVDHSKVFVLIPPFKIKDIQPLMRELYDLEEQWIAEAKARRKRIPILRNEVGFSSLQRKIDR